MLRRLAPLGVDYSKASEIMLLVPTDKNKSHKEDAELTPVLVGKDGNRHRTIHPLAGGAGQEVLRLAPTLWARE
jgi:hypothetical protein